MDVVRAHGAGFDPLVFRLKAVQQTQYAAHRSLRRTALCGGQAGSNVGELLRNILGPAEVPQETAVVIEQGRVMAFEVNGDFRQTQQ